MSDGQSRTIAWYEHAWSGIPFLLIFIGGLIGGACGGLGYGLNVAVFKKDWSGPTKYLTCLGISIGAFVLYIVAIMLLAIIFPGLFSKAQ
jgi:hypothetical protein